LRGRATADPASATAGNFVRAVPMALVVAAVLHADLRFSARGVLIAIASGAVASGIGYVIWYAALRGLTATRAASVQLTVPVLAAAGGWLFLGEALSVRLFLAAGLILGGVGLTMARHGRHER
jgi:drug/metabolite transporter (DMT)-like permease